MAKVKDDYAEEIEALKSKVADLFFNLNDPQPADLRQHRLRQLSKYLIRLIELKYEENKKKIV